MKTNRVNLIKLIFIAAIGLILGFTGGKFAHAGMFLDLDLGAHLTNYHEHEPDGTRWLGNENPIGIVRVGYQTGDYNLFGPVDISAHGYYEHMSSAGTSEDTGVDVIMFGVRFE